MWIIDVNRKRPNSSGIQQLIEIFRVISKEVKIVIPRRAYLLADGRGGGKVFRTIRKLKSKEYPFGLHHPKLSEVFEIGDRVTAGRSTIGNTIETIEKPRKTASGG